ncbi:ATP-binding protein [Leptolyngbya sp. FACHB-1515]
MAQRLRSLDWSQTALGAVETWPQSLRSTCLNSRFPIAIYWGQDCLLLYNDAWRPIVGDKHPWAIARPAREVWSEIWADIGPELAGVLATGEGTFHKDELLSMRRFGYTEECFFEYTFNPIQGQDGVIDGVLNIVSETTYRVLSDRRAQLLREVASQTGVAKTAEASCALITEAFKSDRLDIPFALLYLLDADGKHARLCSSTESTSDSSISDSPINPVAIDLAQNDGGWPIAHAARTAQPQIVNNLVDRFGVISGSPWPEPPQEAMVLPIAATGQNKVTGVLVAVASPRRRLDDQYRDFFTQLTGQIALAIANARAYEQERERAEQLAELDRAKTIFFSNVSHEFRTPLTLMLSPLEELSTALDQRLRDEEREQLQLVQRNGLRLQKLVNTLLDFSRIEAGRVQAVYEPIDLATFTAELASVFRSLVERAGMTLTIDCPPLPQPVYVDRDLWEKIVLNLLSNAFKFTFEGGITVRLRAVDGCAELEVTDTGVGIPAAELPRLFERFHRISGTRARTYEGSGIGLAFVQELVKLHGGTIHISSQVDRGTKFTIAIPLGVSHLPADRIEATRTLTSTALGADAYVEEASRWLSSGTIDRAESINAELSLSVSASFPDVAAPTGRILLVDDNADMREYVKRLLSQQYTVEAVADGIAALAAIRKQLPDLVLSDVMMPNLDGFGLLRELRANSGTQEIPLILLSARAGEEARIEGLEAGADDYLIKPFSARELLARVEASLKLAQLRREAGAALRKSEERYRTLFETMAEGFCVIEMLFDQDDRPIDYRFLITNPAFDQQTGTRNAQGKTVREMVPDHEEYWFEIYGKVALTGEAIRFENHAKGFDAWYEVFAFRRGEPELRQVGVLLNNITDRRQAEAQLRDREAELREAQRIGNIGSCYWDAKTDVTTGSDQLLRIYGFDPERDTIPNFADQDGWLYPHESWQRIHEGVQQALATGLGYELDVQAYRNGTLIWVTTRSEVLRDSNGAIVGLRGTVQDITARKQAEEKLFESEERLRSLLAREQAARESAEAANRVKDEFLAVLSHELRSPLNPILGWSKLLQQGKLDAAKTQTALAAIERNAQLQSQLISDLLDISRILRGKLSLEVRLVDLRAVILAALETVELSAKAKSLRIGTVLPSAVSVSGDAGRLQQVVWNLLSNAVKFTPPAGQVTVTLTQTKTHAQIQVADTGKGIKREFLPYVFEHFRQEDGTTTRKFGGLGLGLAIARQLVEMHGGQISAESLGEGQGATFTVQIPLAAPLDESPAPAQPAASAADLRGLHILVVDDEPDSREFVAFVLEAAGAIVSSAASGIEALQAIEQSAPDLIISDIGMPDMDGYMLMQQVRARQQEHQIPAIALTAYAGEYDQRQAIAAGFQRHLAKPAEPETLVKMIMLLTA